MKSLKQIIVLPLLLCGFILTAQKSKADIIKGIDKGYDKYASVAKQIWDYAEMGYQEYKSSATLIDLLSEEKFSIQKNVADIPTAFVAEYGSGGPVIAILGEFDALPGLSQKAQASKESAGGIGGHACGHHLFGTASSAAAIAVKNYIKANKIEATIRFYGTPAEEGGGAKVYMARAGLFDDVDAVIHWHPGASNDASEGAALANISAKFRFSGISSHAAAAPEKGRSALDGVEAMNYMVNMMREHVPQETRIHYVITDGGKAPNVIPDFAEVYYYSRHNRRDVVRDVFNRIVLAAEGAAKGTETEMSYEIVNGVHEMLPNTTLQKVMYDNLKAIGGFAYTPSEKTFADQIAQSMGMSEADVATALEVQPYKSAGRAFGSTDVGDVSFVAPTVGLRTATWVPGTPAHSWQAVAAGGTSIGFKGMMVAARTMASTIIDLLDQPEYLRDAQNEFEKRRGADFKYVPLLGDRSPALDYRN